MNRNQRSYRSIVPLALAGVLAVVMAIASPVPSEASDASPAQAAFEEPKALATASESHTGLVDGKLKGRSIYFEVVIPASPEEVFSSWTTEAGANQFFGKTSTIEERVGGLYEIKFDGKLPSGRTPGTTGTRILHFERNKALAFEWQAPFFADELNTTPLPTWVELVVAPHSGEEGSTVLRLQHHGFGPGEAWDRVRTFFEHNWFEVLFRLRTLYEQEPAASRSVEVKAKEEAP